jgi:TonB-dependent receptor
MNTIDLNSRIRFVAGVRFEGTNLDSSGPTFDTNGNFIGDTKSNGSYLKVLPSASVRLGVAKDTDVRFVYGRGLSRPNPSDIAQAVTFTVGPPNTASLGNPDLKAETAQNFDVLLEHYLNPFGEIQVGYFYKSLSDPIVNQVFDKNFQPTSQAPPGVYRVTQPINAGSGWVSGFEAAYLQHFSFMPGILKGLGFSANYGYTASQASGLPGRADHPRLSRSAPNTWNISPTSIADASPSGLVCPITRPTFSVTDIKMERPHSTALLPHRLPAASRGPMATSTFILTWKSMRRAASAWGTA